MPKADDATSTQETVLNNDGPLRKLPVWGKKIRDDEIDFEWPTAAIYEQLEDRDNVRLTSIEFKEFGMG